MAKKEPQASANKKTISSGGAGGLWFVGFMGALVYYLHFHSGSFGLVLLAIIKAVFWPVFLVYYLLKLAGA